MKETSEVTIPDCIKEINGMVSITTDTWSYRVYKGYLSLTIHWVDKHWVLRHVLLDFVRFATTHNSNTTSTLLFVLLGDWNQLDKVRAIITDSTDDMISAMTKWTNKLNLRNNTNRYVSDIHVRYIEHVVNLAVRDCFKDIQTYVNQIKSLLSEMRCSVDSRDIYEVTQLQLGVTVPFPYLDVSSRWSSTFNMIRNP